MPHFPSKLQKNRPSSTHRHSDLNATQHKTSSHPIFSEIEEELHDARRVHSHGQEEDLRSALIMVIDRVSELSSLLSDAYKTQAELEVQLNVTKSNLQLVIANNDMLEDALKRDSGQSMDIGWHRTKPPNSSTPPTSSDSRFSKFKFSSSISPNTRPATPTPQGVIVNTHHHLNSPSMPSLPSVRSKEMEDLTAELEKERIARKTIAEEKSALEDELESLSQALFEEANNMVAAERRMRAETEEELKDLKQEKEALRSALRLIGGENTTTSGGRPLSPSKEKQIAEMLASFSPPTSRSSSRMGVKSRPTSLDLFSILPPLPPSPTSSIHEDPNTAIIDGPSDVLSPDEECQPTPTTTTTRSWWAMLRTPNEGSSPWSDVTLNSVSQSKYATVAHTSPTSS